MSKRNITYIKPEEPSFLKRIKEQIGYKEGPTVDTKRENLPASLPEDLEDNDEEQPTVVVLKPGDLTAEEACLLQEKLEKEASETKANLAERVVFSKPKPKVGAVVAKRSTSPSAKGKGPKEKKQKKTKQLLSFDCEEDEDN